MTALTSSEEELVLPEIPVEVPGARLRKVRQSKALEQSRVAAQLHLSESMIEALERDDYVALPGAVFTQGYLRNYARLLGVAEDEVLAAYQRVCPVREHGSLRDKRTGTIAKEVRSSHGVVQLVTWLIVIGLVTLLVIWWQGGRLSWMDRPVTQAPVSDDRAIEAEMAADEPMPAFGETAPDVQGGADIAGGRMPGATSLPQRPASEDVEPSGAMDIADRGPAEAAVKTAEIDTSADGDEADLPLPPETEPTMKSGVAELALSAPAPGERPLNVESADPDRVEAAQTALEPEMTGVSLPPTQAEPASVDPPAAGTAQAAPASGQLVFEFGGRCWAEVRDSTGRARIIGEMRPGSRRVLDAALGPFKIVLGDVTGVSLSVNGKPYDLAPHTRGKVARFTLDQVSP